MLVLLLLAVGATRCRVPPPEVAPGQSAVESVHFLTSHPAVIDYWPCFSPDGRVVIFSRSFDDGKTWALFTVAVTGGTAERLAGPSLPASATRPNWSLRGGRIAFTAEEPNEKATVWIMTPDGSQIQRVVAAGLSDHAYYPSWYPDDQHLVVVDFAEDDQGVVKRIDLAHHTATAMTSAALILAGMPSVSPDGKRIAFAGQENVGQAYDQTKNSIWLLEEGGVPENVSSGLGRTPAWSPDAQWLAFESNRTS
jgi:Tol biopolymer transport system component